MIIIIISLIVLINFHFTIGLYRIRIIIMMFYDIIYII